jgi:hypothetical protein
MQHHADMEKDSVSKHFVVAAVCRLGRTQRSKVAAAGIAEELLEAPEACVPSAESFAAL